MDLAYYGYLAQTIPPRELARALAVRARRALLARLGLLKPLFFEAPRERKRARALYALADRRPSILDPWEREETARLVMERWPKECAAILHGAEAARRGELPIFGQMKDCRKEGAAFEIDY